MSAPSIDLVALFGAYPSRKENPLLPQPDPSVTCVNTHSALCFSGVRTRSAMIMPTEAKTIIVSELEESLTECLLPLMGANHMKIAFSRFDDKEQMVPMMISTQIDKRTVCSGVLSCY